MAAPRPRPAALKLLNGRSPGRDSGGRVVPTPPKFERCAPDAPEWLSDEARAEWDRVVPGLDALGVLKPEDRAALAAYCDSWATYVAATRQCEREGLTLTNPDSGRVHAHPAVAVANTAARQMLRFAVEFGLTPASEQRLAAPTATDDDTDPFGA